MRTTLNIGADALLVIKRYAEEREISFGQATSDLIHRAAESLPNFNMKNGWVVFDVAPGVPPSMLTTDEVETDEYENEYQRAISPRR